MAYETYLKNGSDGQITNNAVNKTSLPATKLNHNRFEKSFNGVPLFTGKIAVRNGRIGEIGISTMQGIYNKFQEDGLTLDKKKSHKSMGY